MKRVLALALVGGALLLGGCDRQQTAAPPAGSDRPAVTKNQAVPTSAESTKSDVDGLLNDVDKQLNSDDQTPADQD